MCNNLNLESLHPVACVDQGESVYRLRNFNIVGFSTFILLHILSIRFTLSTTDPLYLEYYYHLSCSCTNIVTMLYIPEHRDTKNSTSTRDAPHHH
jgi:hypothetical protein